MSEQSANIYKQNPPWFSSQQKRIISYAAIGVGGLAVGGLTFLIVRHSLRKAKANKTEQKTLSDGSPETYAQQLVMAFDHWYGVNMGELRFVVQAIPDMATFKKVTDKYASLTKRAAGAFYQDIAQKLSQSEQREISGILKGKPLKPGQKPGFDWNSAIGITHRIKAALDDKVWGVSYTDTDALEAALRDIPSLTAFAMIKIQYKKEYKKDVEADMSIAHGYMGVYPYDWKSIVYKLPKSTGNEKYK
jgi:hypothetical protein